MARNFRAVATSRRAAALRKALALVALALLSWQVAGIAHAVDLKAHEGKLSCHLCQVHDRSDSSPPLESRLVLLDAAFERPANVGALPQAHPDRPVPAARGPPALALLDH